MCTYLFILVGTYWTDCNETEHVDCFLHVLHVRPVGGM